MTQPTVIAVASDDKHNIVKPVRDSIALVKGWGVEGDAHAGTTVQHRYDKRRNPDAPNLRQIHLMHAELFDEVAELGMHVAPGQMGENITTRNLNILHLPRGTRLEIGDAVIEVTGLRNPCKYLNKIAPGLMQATLANDETGKPFPKSGIMGIILEGGVVRAGDRIHVIVPKEPHERLKPV